jgi:hypothetical protein
MAKRRWLFTVSVRGGTRQLPELCSAHGGVAGPEQRGVVQHESPHGRCMWGPSGARCVPLVRLLLIRPRFLVQRDQKALRAAPWALFRARRHRWAGVAGLFFKGG